MKILVIKLSSLGDLFHPLPAVHVLRKHLKAKVHWVTQPEYASLVKCFDDVDEVFEFPRRHFFLGFCSFFKSLRKQRYEYVFDMQGLLKSALVCGMARGQKKIGPSFIREGASVFYSHITGLKNTDQHAVDQCLEAVRFMNFPTEEVVFPLSFPRHAHTEKPYVVLVPCSRWPAKNWPLERFATVARHIISTYGFSVVLLGSQEDIGASKILEKAIAMPIQNLAGQLSLVELGSWIQSAALCISNDSGPMHIAAALNTPLIALFGPTDPKKTGPYKKPETVIRPQFSKAPGHRSYKSGDTSFIEQVTVEEALKRTQKILGGAV